MFHRPNKRLRALTGALLGTAVLMTVMAPITAHARGLKGSFRGNAYGTFANAAAGNIATQLGRSAYVECPCSGTDGKVQSNLITSLRTERKVVASKAVRTTAYGKKTADSAATRQTSKIVDLNALDGLITADGIKAVAGTNAGRRKILSSAGGSHFVNLRVAGQKVPVDIAAGSRRNLPGIGHVEIKRVTRNGNGASSGGIQVEMLRIVVERSNSFDLPIGAELVLAHAKSGFVRHQPVIEVGGSAYASSSKTSSLSLRNNTGRSAAIYMGCGGTQGRTRSNNINLLDVPGVLNAGTGRTTAYGGKSSSGSVARTTATVENLNLLDPDGAGALPGLVTADLVRAAARSTYGSGSGTASSEGSRFVNLTVAGVPIAADVQPNSRADIPGLGYVRLYQRTQTSGRSGASSSVQMIHLYVTQSNDLGLPVNTELVVASAKSKAHPF